MGLTLFWSIMAISGARSPLYYGYGAARMRALIKSDINLFYHLPLDCHPQHGNNASLGRLMGIEAPEALDPEDPGTPVFRGQLEGSVTVQGLAERLSIALDRSPLVIGEGEEISGMVHRGRARLYRPRRRCGR